MLIADMPSDGCSQEETNSPFHDCLEVVDLKDILALICFFKLRFTGIHGWRSVKMCRQRFTDLASRLDGYWECGRMLKEWVISFWHFPLRNKWLFSRLLQLFLYCLNVVWVHGRWDIKVWHLGLQVVQGRNSNYGYQWAKDIVVSM